MKLTEDLQKMADIVYSGQATELRRMFLKMVFAGEEEATRTALSYLTAGSHLTQQLVAIQIDSIVDRVAMEYNPRKPRNDVYKSITRVMKEIIIAFHVAEIIEEVDIERPTALEARVMRAAALKGNERFRNPMAAPASYWRGMTLLVAAGMDTPKEIAVNSAAFADWAGSHSQPGLILELVKERKTLDVPTLETLLDQQNSNHRAVGNGVL